VKVRGGLWDLGIGCCAGLAQRTAGPSVAAVGAGWHVARFCALVTVRFLDE